jgi:hypothetical protein
MVSSYASTASSGCPASRQAPRQAEPDDGIVRHQLGHLFELRDPIPLHDEPPSPRYRSSRPIAGSRRRSRFFALSEPFPIMGTHVSDHRSVARRAPERVGVEAPTRTGPAAPEIERRGHRPHHRWRSERKAGHIREDAKPPRLGEPHRDHAPGVDGWRRLRVVLDAYEVKGGLLHHANLFAMARDVHSRWRDRRPEREPPGC